MSSKRDDVRTKFFAVKVSSRLVTLKSGAQVEVRQPTVGDGLSMAMMEDIRGRILRMFCDHVFIPGTDEKVFDESDHDLLMALPNAGDYQAITTALNELMDITVATKEASKNSAPTPA